MVNGEKKLWIKIASHSLTHKIVLTIYVTLELLHILFNKTIFSLVIEHVMT